MSLTLTDLRHRITMGDIPFTDRGSRIMVLLRDGVFHVQVAESWSEDHPWTLVTIGLLDADTVPLDIDIDAQPHRVDVTADGHDFALGFADAETLILSLPAGRCGLQLTTRNLMLVPDRPGGIFQPRGEPLLTAAYTTNAAIIRQETAADDDGAQVTLLLNAVDASTCLTLNITRTNAPNRCVPDFDMVTEAARLRWQAWLQAAPAVPEAYRSQVAFAWWVLGSNLIRLYSHPKREGVIPSKRGYVGVWNWDSYFHVIALRHAQPVLARDQFRILLDHQLPNGLIPDVIQDSGALSHTTDYGIDADITKPPLTAWAVWKLHEAAPDIAFLDEVYDALVRAQRWWFAEHDADGNGLCEYAHPYSSGLDNSPLFDARAPVESPDLTAYLILQYDHLAAVARVLGRDDEAETWTAEAEALTRRLIDLRWDDEAGYFWSWCNGAPVRVRTPISLMPLITGRLPGEVSRRLVDHLTSPSEFWARFPVPTVALDDPYHNPEVMWRGPVWININYLLIEGLKRSGYREEARALRRKTLDMMMRQPDIYEYYHPQTGEKPPRAVSTFGWSAALFIDLVLDEAADAAI
ncbi:MAG: glycogen debranching protein [Anaerolineae bacterium]|nr:glycogen debranching protein [Anaerolineae bacterium]